MDKKCICVHNLPTNICQLDGTTKGALCIIYLCAADSAVCAFNYCWCQENEALDKREWYVKCV